MHPLYAERDGRPGRAPYRRAVTQTDSELALAAAEAGSAVVRARYGQPLARFAKSGTDFATEADLEAEAEILRVLRAARPQDAALGEETGYAGPPEATRTWLVDPLCGTLNFAARTPLVAVNVALRDGAEVRVGVSADPLAGELFWTDGRYARVRRAGVDERLLPSADSRLVDINLEDASPDTPTFRTALLLADAEFAERFSPRVMSTSLALAWVAAGRRAAYVTDGELRDSVHFASGIALCQAAGCVVTDLEGHPVHSGAGGMIAAADRETHTVLQTLISRSATERRPSSPS